MRGHLVKRGKGSWSIVLHLGRDPATGKRKQQWISVKGTKRDAERKLAELQHQLETGGFVKPTRVSVSEFLTRWLRDYAATNVRDSTYEGYRRIVEGHLVPSIGHICLVQLQPHHIQDYYAGRMRNGRRDGKGGLSSRSVAGHHRILREALSHAVKWGLLARNVAEAVDPPRYTVKEFHTLDAEGVYLLLGVARDSSYYSIIYLAVHTGLRRSELLGLRWKDTDLDLLSLSVVQVLQNINGKGLVLMEPKTAKSKRAVALTPSCASVLRHHRAKQEAERTLFGLSLTDDDFVFSKPDGQPLTPDVVSHTFAKIVRGAGLKGLRFHDLRHTHATLMLKQGVHPKIVSERLGHANIQMTLDTYSHVLPGLQEAAAQKFDEWLTGFSQTDGIRVSGTAARLVEKVEQT